MKASIVDLRYKTNEILKALEKNETVEVLYHGKLKGIIHPPKIESKNKVKQHLFFNMKGETDQTVLEELEQLRKPRRLSKNSNFKLVISTYDLVTSS